MSTTLLSPIVRAKSHGLHRMARRLGELSSMDLDDGDLPISDASMSVAVDYAIARKKPDGMNPLIAATSGGLIQLTWWHGDKKAYGKNAERVIMQFGSNGNVIYAFNRKGGRGSGDTTAADLLSDNPPFDLPSWA